MNEYLYEMEYSSYVDLWNTPLMTYDEWRNWRNGVGTSVVEETES